VGKQEYKDYILCIREEQATSQIAQEKNWFASRTRKILIEQIGHLVLTINSVNNNCEVFSIIVLNFLKPVAWCGRHALSAYRIAFYFTHSYAFDISLLHCI
jgi:hypothetical protein